MAIHDDDGVARSGVRRAAFPRSGRRGRSGVTRVCAVVRAVRNALVLSFVAEVLALLTGRLPWPSLLVVLASASYLVEAFDGWREERTAARRPAQQPVQQPVQRPAPALDAATSVSLAVVGTRGLTVLPRPRDHVDVPDVGAPADEADKLLQRV